jgi:hypothetical protein
MKGRHQEVWAVRPDDDRIDRLESIVGNIQVVAHHHNRNVREDLFDLMGHDRTVQQAEVKLDHHRIHGLRHQETQALIPASCGHKAVSVLLQVEELTGIAMNAE